MNERDATPSLPTDEEPAPGSAAALSFLDLLYAVPVADVATRVSAHGGSLPWAAWGAVAVSLALVVFSWVGYHRNRAQAAAHSYRKRIGDFGFFEARFAQFIVEILILVAYVGVGLRIDQTDHHRVIGPSAPWVGTWIAIVFALYLVWDLFDRGLARSDSAADTATSYLVPTVVAFVVFSGSAAAAWTLVGDDRSAAAWFDVVMVALLYAYRVSQDLRPWRARSKHRERAALAAQA